MADVTIYKPASVTVQVIDGDPPADQSALIAQLNAQIVQLTTDLATRTAERDAALAQVAVKSTAIAGALADMSVADTNDAAADAASAAAKSKLQGA